MSLPERIEAARRSAPDAQTAEQLASDALKAGEEEAAIPVLRVAAERLRSARLWQWTGLLQRAIDEHSEALRSFETASRLAPNDPGIAHGHARVALEAGIDAVELFARAQSLAPSDGAIIIGRTAALLAAGLGKAAEAELDDLLRRAPLWIEGHDQLAQLRALLGKRERATESIERALAVSPASGELWAALLGTHLRRQDFRQVLRDLDRARKAGVQPGLLAQFAAICAAELDSEIYPAPLFAGAPPDLATALSVWRIRHLLRVGRIEAALPLIDAALKTEQAPLIWPYASLAWRISEDPRWEWLEQEASLVQVFDLSPNLPPIPELERALRSLHRAEAEYLDQSVRGGTQTDGPLLSRIDPVIRRLRSAIVGAVEQYVASVGASDEAHPLLSQRRDRRVRFAGSWSVRLRSGGRHSNHVHPQGWLSSALYVTLPRHNDGEPDDAGWFTLGEPDEALGLDLPAWRKVEPKPGHLILFPSWMWHGTRAFAEGERLTVAFDVAPPR